jgi:hypothetical protein
MHRTSKKRRTHRAMVAAAAAVGLSGTLVLGHVAEKLDVDLAATVFAVGGRGDAVSANVKNKLGGNIAPAAFGNSYSLVEIHYPADFNFQNSTTEGVAALEPQVGPALATGPVRITSYSEGTLTAEQVKRDLANSGITGDLTFLFIASPYVPNGGLFARFPGFTIPGVVPVFSAVEPTKYESTYVVNEYDPYADFPAYFNPLSLLNTLAAIAYVHPDQYYDTVNYNPLTNTGTTPVLVKTVTNSAGGTDRYVFVPAAHLPLLAPVRQIFDALGLTPLTEPILSAIEPVLRLVVDMGYTDRQNLNPEVPVEFSLITPPARIIETIAKVPDALGQGVNNFATEGGSIPAPVVPKIAPTNSPSINAKSLPQEPQESLVNNDPTSAGEPDPAPPQAPSGSSNTPPTGPPVSPLKKTGPTLGKVTEDGNMSTPNPSTKTKAPKKNLLTQLTDTLTEFFSPKKPESSTPSTEPDNSAPTPQSGGQPSAAA